jgi:hypothetical protein
MKTTYSMALLGTICLLFGFAAPVAFASDTRVETMGAVNHVIRDNYNIWLYPSTLTEYPNLAVLGLGGRIITPTYFDPFQNRTFSVPLPGFASSLGSDIYGGSTVKLNSKSALGFFASAANNTGIEFGNATQRFDLFYGMKMEQLALGLHVGRTSGMQKSSNSQSPASNVERSVGLWDFQVGIGSELSGMGSFEAAFNLGLLSFTNKFGGQKQSEPDGNLNLGARARLFYKMNEQLTLVPNAEFIRNKIGVKSGTGATASKQENVSSTLLLGVGFLYKPQENYLFVSHVFFDRMSEKETDTPPAPARSSESKDTFTTLPGVSVGLDAQLRKWIAVRFGVVKWLGKAKFEGGTTTTEFSAAPFDWAMGIGIHVGDLLIDLGMDRDFIKRGPNALSGQTGPMFPKATLLYTF